jgi:hypothetical protein
MKLHFWIIHDFLPVFFIEWGIFFSFSFSVYIMNERIESMRVEEEKKSMKKIFFAGCVLRT